MPFPLIPMVIMSLASGAYAVKRHRDKTKEATPQQAAERMVIYETAINTIKDPDKLRLLAKAFGEAGCTAEEKMLNLRAENAEAPPEVKEARQKAFRDGMSSRDVAGIRNLANAFESQGAPGAARDLRAYAMAVEANAQSATEGTVHVEP